MDLADIKETYYKRYGASKNFLNYEYTGALCSLLGYPEIMHSPSLTCTLSMGIGMLARRLNGNTVKIQGTDSDKRFSYTPPKSPTVFKGIEREAARLIMSLKKYNKSGAEILYNYTIPDFLPQKTEFYLTLAKSLMRVWGEEADMYRIATHAARGELLAPYLAAAHSKSGYCTFLNEGVTENYPLPMSGYKIVSAYCMEKDRGRESKIQAAFERIREKYPPVNSITDITPGHIACVKEKTSANYMLHLSGENLRIKTAAEALGKCDIKTLFKEMNASQKSMERCWNLGDEHLFLAQCAKGLEGVMAVRCVRDGIIMIAENDFVDYAVNMIRNEFENNAGYQPTFCVSEAV